MPRQIPEDPMVRNIIRLLNQQKFSRRQLLRGAGVAGASAGALSLAACGAGGGGGGSSDEIIWGNWTYYLDFDEETGTNPTLEAFNETSDFQVLYVEDIDDNNTFYGKIKDALALDQFTGYDVITMTDWMNARLIDAGQIQEFDYANLPNVESNLLESEWEALAEDQGRKFTIPWQLPTTGWAWNKEAFPNGLHTLDDLLDPALKGKVQVLSEMRDTIGLIMAGQGVDPAGDWGDTEFDNAMAWLQDALDSGQINNVKGNDYTQDLQTGTMLAGFVWYGDVVMMNTDLGDQWGVEIPESGGMIARDSFTVPNGTSAENKAKVEELIDYYYQPEVAAEVAAYVAYVTPVQGAQEAMQNVDPSQVDNPAIFPTDDDWTRLRQFRALTSEEDNRYSTAFQQALGL
ncbi:ABC transporter substrate-binding protein [Leucobacter denitrificans]|uniref:Extracellular solute-binding protein n=1 Tax=Leucobacter denitrificans TaxID=683042 RepID=A0A7G9S4L9_9MICO|nr:extracellular solute-binding protein [Leucobacter denitrificans]QNN62794.1 extracellular solute-binding protein [Leucobacter denitrificans]